MVWVIFNGLHQCSGSQRINFNFKFINFEIPCRDQIFSNCKELYKKWSNCMKFNGEPVGLLKKPPHLASFSPFQAPPMFNFKKSFEGTSQYMLVIVGILLFLHFSIDLQNIISALQVCKKGVKNRKGLLHFLFKHSCVSGLPDMPKGDTKGNLSSFHMLKSYTLSSHPN